MLISQNNYLCKIFYIIITTKNSITYMMTILFSLAIFLYIYIMIYEQSICFAYFLDSEWNNDECIDFKMMCVFFYFFCICHHLLGK